MDAVSLPMVPDLTAFSRPVRYVILGVLVLGPLCLAAAVLVGITSSPTVVVEATVVDSPPPDAEVYAVSDLPEESPVKRVVEQAVVRGSAATEVRTETLRSDGVPTRGVYIRHDDQVVKVSVNP